MDRVYALASKSTHCVGHGDYREQIVIDTACGVFETREEAEAYKKRVDKWNFLHVVTMKYTSNELGSES